MTGEAGEAGWTRPEDLRRQVRRLWDRGVILASLVTGEALWGTEDRPIHRDLPRLTAQERALYDDLRDHRIGRARGDLSGR